MENWGAMIRVARDEDAEDFCSIIRRSIIELCFLDHAGDNVKLEHWLSNKNVENCRQWIQNENTCSLVAELEGQLCGIAQMGADGHLYLLYLLPEVKGKGVGKALLQAAEQFALERGHTRLTLESTLTARDFYTHSGYSLNQAISPCESSCLSMHKLIG